MFGWGNTRVLKGVKLRENHVNVWLEGLEGKENLGNAKRKGKD